MVGILLCPSSWWNKAADVKYLTWKVYRQQVSDWKSSFTRPLLMACPRKSTRGKLHNTLGDMLSNCKFSAPKGVNCLAKTLKEKLEAQPHPSESYLYLVSRNSKVGQPFYFIRVGSFLFSIWNWMCCKIPDESKARFNCLWEVRKPNDHISGTKVRAKYLIIYAIKMDEGGWNDDLHLSYLCQ